MGKEFDKGYEEGKSGEWLIWAFGFVLGAMVAVSITMVADAANVGMFHEFDQYEDCQEVWDMYPYVSETFDASHAVWAKLGFTDLEVHEFEYCINHAPGGNYDES